MERIKTKKNTKDIHIRIDTDIYNEVKRSAEIQNKTISKELKETIEFMYKDLNDKKALKPQEKEYLTKVIEPIKDHVLYIVKEVEEYEDCEAEWLHIELDIGMDNFVIPTCTSCNRYSLMKLKEEYTLSELGI